MSFFSSLLVWLLPWIQSPLSGKVGGASSQQWFFWSCQIHPLRYLSVRFSTQEWAFRMTYFISFEFSFPTLEGCTWFSPWQRDWPLCRGLRGEWMEEMREGRLAGIDRTRERVCEKGVKETERRYRERVWKEDQDRCMKLLTGSGVTSIKTPVFGY